jgi:hypothetical protein
MEKQLTVHLRMWGCVIKGKNGPKGEPVMNKWTNFQVRVNRGSTRETLRELWQAEQIACREIIGEEEIIDVQNPRIPEESIDGLDDETPVEILWQEGNSTWSRWVSRKFKEIVGQRAYGTDQQGWSGKPGWVQLQKIIILDEVRECPQTQKGTGQNEKTKSLKHKKGYTDTSLQEEKSKRQMNELQNERGRNWRHKKERVGIHSQEEEKKKNQELEQPEIRERTQKERNWKHKNEQ